MNARRGQHPNPLPREIAPGIFWLGDCIQARLGERMLHAYQSVYLVTGEEHSLLVEAGLSTRFTSVEDQLDELLAAGAPPLRYAFITHHETPHAGGLGRILERFPDVEAVGDVTDFHLILPQYRDRLRSMQPGDELDLGGTTFRVEQGILVDFRSTLWGFDTARRVLFSADGFSYAHYHEAGQCGRFAEDVSELDIPSMAAIFSQISFYWTNFVALEPYFSALEERLFAEDEVSVIAPTHGLPIGDPRATFPKIREGVGRAGV
jgi:flavorubredoxin